MTPIASPPLASITPLLHHTDQTVFIERLQGKIAYSFFLCSPARSPTRMPSVLRTHTVLGTSGWEKLPTGHAPWSSPPGVPGQRHSVIQEGSTLWSCPWSRLGLCTWSHSGLSRPRHGSHLTALLAPLSILHSHQRRPCMCLWARLDIILDRRHIPSLQGGQRRSGQGLRKEGKGAELTPGRQM